MKPVIWTKSMQPAKTICPNQNKTQIFHPNSRSPTRPWHTPNSSTHSLPTSLSTTPSPTPQALILAPPGPPFSNGFHLPLSTSAKLTSRPPIPSSSKSSSKCSTSSNPTATAPSSPSPTSPHVISSLSAFHVASSLASLSPTSWSGWSSLKGKMWEESEASWWGKLKKKKTHRLCEECIDLWEVGKKRRRRRKGEREGKE